MEEPGTSPSSARRLLNFRSLLAGQLHRTIRQRHKAHRVDEVWRITALRMTEPELKEAGLSLGLNRLEVFWHITLPKLKPVDRTDARPRCPELRTL